MNKYNKCLYCYKNISNTFYHSKCSKILFGENEIENITLSNKYINLLAKNYVNQRLAVTGVQKKLSLNLTKSNEKNRLTIVGFNGGNFILKPPNKNYLFMPEIEDLSMKLAKIYGIKTAIHGLIPMDNGDFSYITKRFDRKNNKKIAIEDLCQLSNKLTNHKYRSSYEKVGKIINKYSSNPGDDILRYFEILLFSFLTGNSDMHLKNFSLITQDIDNIKLSPAYDLLNTRLLIPNHLDDEEMALPINGKKHNIKEKDFFILGQNLKIPEVVIKRVIKKLCLMFDKFKQTIEQSFLPYSLQQQYINLIKSQISLFNV